MINYNPVISKEEAIGTDQVALYVLNAEYIAEFIKEGSPRHYGISGYDPMYIVFDHEQIKVVYNDEDELSDHWGLNGCAIGFIRENGRCLWSRFTKVIQWNEQSNVDYDCEQIDDICKSLVLSVDEALDGGVVYGCLPEGLKLTEELGNILTLAGITPETLTRTARDFTNKLIWNLGMQHNENNLRWKDEYVGLTVEEALKIAETLSEQESV